MSDPSPSAWTRASDEPAEERDLAIAFKAGEAGAYDAIYERYSLRVDRLCRRMLGDPHDAQEASQEAFLRVYQGLPRFNGRYQLGAWITRITTNVCLDQLRARTRRPVDLTAFEELQNEPVDVKTEVDPEALVIRNFEGRRVRRILDGLPPLHRAAIVLRDFEGYSYEEVATALGISECQVKALIHRARRGFRKSWSVPGLAAIVPGRLFHRFRRFDSTVNESTNHAARSASSLSDIAASASHAVSSCSVMLQQCGQVMSEKFAGVVTATLVGTAAAASLPAMSQPPPQKLEAQTIPSATASTSEDEVRPNRVRATKDAETSSKESPSNEPSPETEQPAGQPPAPAPTPSASPSEAPPSSSPAPEPKASPSAAPPPVVAKPLTPSIGFYSGEPIPETTPESEVSTVDCATGTVRQSLQTQIYDSEGSYPGRVTLELGASAALTFSLVKDDKELNYNGGSWKVYSSSSGSKMTLSFSGSYSQMGKGDPASSNLPSHGRFDGSLTLDCTTSRVITERLQFHLE